jgi:hypothetical protein
MPVIHVKQLKLIAIAIVAACLALFVGALPLFPAYARQMPPWILPNARWTTEAAMAALASLGWTPDTYVLVRLAFVVVTALLYCGSGLFILLRRSTDSFALLLALSLVVFGVASTDAPYVVARMGVMGERVAYGLSVIAYGLLMFVIPLFPDGRFTPRWTRWIGIAGVALVTYVLFFEPRPTRPPAAPIVAMISVVFLAGGAGQVARYRAAQTAMQRQQTKWVLWAILINLAFQLGLNVIYASPAVNALNGQGMAFSLLRTATLILVTATIPVALTLAILRYRLFDIDVVIRKTLVYSVLTVLLALVYFGSVILLQRLFGALTGIEQSTLAVVISTLAIAALFTPLRRRIQDAIDRRFFRKKYNAQQVLAQFAVTARDETDLDALLAELVRVVDETLQPEHVSIWLRKQEAPKSALASPGLTE